MKKFMVGVLSMGLAFTSWFVQPASAETTCPDVPKKEKIVFAEATVGEAAEVFTINPDGSGKKQLTYNGTGGMAHRPQVSPCGDKIVYWNYENTFILMNSDGTNQQTFTGSNPTWTPDGKIVFYRGKHTETGYETELFQMNPDGTNVIQLTNTPGSNEIHPIVGPDGTIYYLKQNVNGIYKMTPNGDGTYTHSQVTDSQVTTYMDVSPDGTKLVFGSGGETYIINTDGTGKTLLTADYEPYTYNPTFNPDGTKIAVDVTDTTTWDRGIMTMNVDGTQKNTFERKSVGKTMGDWAKVVQ